MRKVVEMEELDNKRKYYINTRGKILDKYYQTHTNWGKKVVVLEGEINELKIRHEEALWESKMVKTLSKAKKLMWEEIVNCLTSIRNHLKFFLKSGSIYQEVKNTWQKIKGWSKAYIKLQGWKEWW